MWLGLELKNNAKKTCLKDIELHVQNLFNHPEVKSQHDWGTYMTTEWPRESSL